MKTKSFDQWWGEYLETLDDSDYEIVAKDAWNKCKKECIKILKKNLTSAGNSYIMKGAIDQVKDL